MQLQRGIECIEGSLVRLAELALGGTAVGTGLNTPPGYAVHVASNPIVIFIIFFTLFLCIVIIDDVDDVVVVV